jgi:hypothetical protein
VLLVLQVIKANQEPQVLREAEQQAQLALLVLLVQTAQLVSKEVQEPPA